MVHSMSMVDVSADENSFLSDILKFYGVFNGDRGIFSCKLCGGDAVLSVIQKGPQPRDIKPNVKA